MPTIPGYCIGSGRSSDNDLSAKADCLEEEARASELLYSAVTLGDIGVPSSIICIKLSVEQRIQKQGPYHNPCANRVLSPTFYRSQTLARPSKQASIQNIVRNVNANADNQSAAVASLNAITKLFRRPIFFRITGSSVSGSGGTCGT